MEEKINGVSARWYLIYEDDKTDDADSQGAFVWIFGGWVKEIANWELSDYEEKRKELLKTSEPGW